LRALGGAFAVVLAAEATRSTATAAPRPVYEHGVALADRGHARADLFDSSGVLVAERERKFPGKHALRPVHEMEIGVTRTRTADLDDDFAWPGLRYTRIAQLCGFAPTREL
jgi:hypothetical protein